MRPAPGSHPPRPKQGSPELCFAAAAQGLYELWVHPDDTAALTGDAVVVNGRRGRGELVDRLAFADQIRVVLGAPA